MAQRLSDQAITSTATATPISANSRPHAGSASHASNSLARPAITAITGRMPIDVPRMKSAKPMRDAPVITFWTE